MNAFLAIYTGAPESMSKWNTLSEAEQKDRLQKGIAAWHAWGDKHKEIILDMGGPLGKTKHISPTGIADIRNAMTGYTLIKAASYEGAAKLFENHPHFTILPGDGVEVMECLPISGLGD